MEWITYRIVRFFFKGDKRRHVVARGLTLEEAQQHCSDPETSSRTATKPSGTERTRRRGPWFDGYEKE